MESFGTNQPEVRPQTLEEILAHRKIIEGSKISQKDAFTLFVDANRAKLTRDDLNRFLEEKNITVEAPAEAPKVQQEKAHKYNIYKQAKNKNRTSAHPRGGPHDWSNLELRPEQSVGVEQPQSVVNHREAIFNA